MDYKLIGVVKMEKSEIHISIAEKDGHYYVRIFDTQTINKVKYPNNAVLLLNNNELELIICTLNHPNKNKGSSEWDVLISELENKSLHLRRRKNARSKIEYDLRKYINTSTLTGWLNSGINFDPKYTILILNHLKVALSELELMNNGANITNKSNSSILDNIFDDFGV